MSKFALISDLHFHNWSAFSTPTISGINSRLEILLNEVIRAADTLRNLGGKTMIVTGDIFHVRGSVAPSVLNPVRDMFEEVERMGVRVYALAGNHDLEGKHSTELGSAITSLNSKNFRAVNHHPVYLDKAGAICAVSGGTPVFALIPWHENQAELLKTMRGLSAVDYVAIHAPLNDVIPGLPNTGIDPLELAAMGHEGVFSGHYHNHKRFPRNVFSVGAIAHHTWSDIGSKAGFIIVNPDTNDVQFFASHGPEFIELDASLDEASLRLAVDGNYVRFRTDATNSKDIEDIRKFLHDSGAAGVVVISEPTLRTATRSGTTISSSMTTRQSVAAYIAASKFGNKDELAALCDEIAEKSASVN